ncbi:lipopolysaccharide biosynthesis protein [Frateuria soli]|uniref:lipopolysaccharide biosynthesis protein n=1 Tax=Frateuria soli TaxID=1542730 RepID=UPI001E5AA7AE|nr:lipopolysaccharide biosynthesis protein [Frateuria soli]UGB38523.1 lipopolysaccharide biosynthesis protein [Frateuria soli]
MFDMQHVHRDLRRHSVRGAAATMVSQAGMFCVQLAGLALLARLLMPADFGVFGKTVALTGFITVLRSGGLSLATVQRAEVTHAQVSTLFWLNLAVGLAAATLLAALGPLMAWFYRDPRVLWLVVALAGSIFVDSLSIQHTALMQRQMRFGTIGSINVAARIVGFVMAIGSAWQGAGYWALVVQQYGTSLAMLVLVVSSCHWLPDLPRRGSGVRPMVKMGAHQSLSNVLNFANRNMDNILIGRFVSDVALGFYSQAYRLLLLPVQQINSPISSVVVPALSRLQDQPERFARFYYRAMGTMTFLGMPVICFLLVDAHSVIRVVLGEKWLPVVPLFQTLGVAAFMGTFNVAGGWVYSALGQTARRLRQQAFSCPVTIGAFFSGLPWGALGVAAAFSITRVVLVWPALAYCYRGSPITTRGTFTTLIRPATAAIGAGLALWGIRAVAPWRDQPLWVVLDGLIYAAIYMAIWLVVPGGRARLREMKSLLHDLKPKTNQGCAQ